MTVKTFTKSAVTYVFWMNSDGSAKRNEFIGDIARSISLAAEKVEADIAELIECGYTQEQVEVQ